MIILASKWWVVYRLYSIIYMILYIYVWSATLRVNETVSIDHNTCTYIRFWINLLLVWVVIDMLYSIVQYSTVYITSIYVCMLYTFRGIIQVVNIICAVIVTINCMDFILYSNIVYYSIVLLWPIWYIISHNIIYRITCQK